VAAFLTKMHAEIDHEASRVKAEKSGAKTAGEKWPIFDPNNRKLRLPDA